MSREFYAVPFGTDGTCGDTIWQPEMTFLCKKDESFEALKAELYRLAKTGGEDSQFGILVEDEDYIAAELAGFWIIEASVKKVIESIDPGNLGNDSAVYRHVSTLKQVIQAAAIKTVTK